MLAIDDVTEDHPLGVWWSIAEVAVAFESGDPRRDAAMTARGRQNARAILAVPEMLRILTWLAETDDAGPVERLRMRQDAAKVLLDVALGADRKGSLP